jgi:transcriptional regulator with XRE-family HTH domain
MLHFREKVTCQGNSRPPAEPAESLDLENVTVSRIETGAQMPSIDRLDAISKVLKVSLTALMADTTKGSAVADMLVEVIKGLPLREQKFVYSLAAETYAAHYKCR